MAANTKFSIKNLSMKNLKIRNKLLVIFGALLILLTVISFGAFYMTKRLSNLYDSFYNDQFKQTELVLEMQADTEALMKYAVYALLEDDKHPSTEESKDEEPKRDKEKKDE